MSGIHLSRGVPRQPPACRSLTIAPAFRRYVLMAAGALGFEQLAATEGSLHFSIPNNQQGAWNNYPELLVAFETADPTETQPSELLTLLSEQLAERDLVLQAAPVDQPESVHQLSEQIYAPYKVDNGRAHLSGCSLEPRPFLRLSSSPNFLQAKHWFFDEAGQPVDPAVVSQLAMNQLAPFSPGAARLPAERLSTWIVMAQAALASEDDAPADITTTVATVVWCRHASGKLTFEIGGEEVSLQFSGWAREIASGNQPMPMYHCPLTGRETFHLAADDEGQITAFEAIAICEVSGARVMETKLEICQETGLRAQKEHLATCEQTHRRVLKRTLQVCEMCRRKLAPISLVKNRCEACRHLTPVSKDDPTLARLLHQYSKLDAWSRWRIGETPHLFIFTAQSWTQRLLVVVDKHSLDVTRLAIRSRFVTHWRDCPPQQFEELTS